MYTDITQKTPFQQLQIEENTFPNETSRGITSKALHRAKKQSKTDTLRGGGAGLDGEDVPGRVSSSLRSQVYIQGVQRAFLRRSKMSQCLTCPGPIVLLRQAPCLRAPPAPLCPCLSTGPEERRGGDELGSLLYTFGANTTILWSVVADLWTVRTL